MVNFDAGVGAFAWCSTPFGITEVGIGLRSRAVRARAEVLNAFRHHRGGHGRAIECRKTCDKVLNAFRHHRGGHGETSQTPATTSSAQRLSASQRWASAPYNADGTVNTSAQRLSASQRWAFAVDHAAAVRCFKCSTPFGITEVGIPEIRSRPCSRAPSAQRLSASQRWAYFHTPITESDQMSVLNAFRHHRGGHLLFVQVKQRINLCSTPFGITEVGIDRTQGNCPGHDRAQRLSASQRWASPPQ